VILHARDEARARAAMRGVPGAAAALAGDLASIARTRELARRIDAAGPFDAIIHNAGVGYRERRLETEDGVERVFHTNVLAPYLLTALVQRPKRLIYLGSGVHRSGGPDLADLRWERRPWNAYQAYADSKLFDAVLAAAVARLWPDVVSTSVDPGRVRTRMGGPAAPGEIGPGADTQVWLATSDDPVALQSGRYFRHRRPFETHPAVTGPQRPGRPPRRLPRAHRPGAASRHPLAAQLHARRRRPVRPQRDRRQRAAFHGLAASRRSPEMAGLVPELPARADPHRARRSARRRQPVRVRHLRPSHRRRDRRVRLGRAAGLVRPRE
jgi:NAD(P)-dependent dehydrogenase (short-subunit alcohol dehydrogenase family)